MKIINIASSDNFEDIIEAVKESDSEKVVLVVPKSNRVFKSKNRVSQLKERFKKTGKEVSIMSGGGEKETAKKISKKKPGRDGNLNVPVSRAKRDEEINDLYSEKTPTWEEPQVNQASNGTRKFIVIFLAVAIFSFIFTISFVFNQAKIRVIPKKEIFSINFPITVSSAITEPDPIYGLVSGETVQFGKEAIRNFPATGEKEIFQKAKGRITIYNKYSSQPQVLVATTRFQTAEGLVFRIPQTVTVPGAAGSGSNLKPGRIEVEAIADRAGGEYNIGSSEFRIPGFLGSPRYQGFYAESSESFSGGFIGKAKVVTKEDVEAAEKSVREELSNEIKKQLTGLAGLKIITEAFEIKIEKMPDSNKAGDVAAEFRLRMKAEVFGIAFDESGVKELVSRYVRNSESKDILQSGLNFIYSEPDLDKDKQELSLNLAASGRTVRGVNKEKIASEIRGKSGLEIKNYFSSLDEVESANIYFFPFWMKSAPKKMGKIQVQVIPE